jgi:hypothetical protein
MKSDQDALTELEQQIGEKIPKVKKIGETTFGYEVTENRVVGLGLYKKGLN